MDTLRKKIEAATPNSVATQMRDADRGERRLERMVSEAAITESMQALFRPLTDPVRPELITSRKKDMSFPVNEQIKLEAE